MSSKDGRSGFCVLLAVVLAAPLVWAGPALAGAGLQFSTEYGIEFSRIGSPGNRPTNASEAPFRPGIDGAVDYEYRISRTPVSVGLYAEFANAYSPFVDRSSLISTEFSSSYLHDNPDGTLTPGSPGLSELFAVDVGWRFAARFVNWLHNDKATNREAFESGVYDTSTFGNVLDSDGRIVGYTDVLTPATGARYWIPTLDEYRKAAYYDPNRYGEGEEGYWRYPNSSDSVLTPGLPSEDGSETNAGPSLGLLPVPIGSYPSTQSPWGLLDVSGGEREYIFSQIVDANTPFGELRGSPVTIGSRWRDSLWDFTDRVDWFGSGGFGGVPFDNFSFRLAAPVPGPATCMLFAISALPLFSRSRT